MRRILPIIILGFISKMGMSQNNIESELNKIIYQSENVENAYLDSLFNLISPNQIDETTTRIDIVLDRFELLSTSKDYEKVAKVYSNGKPIVKSIKNNHTQITYWNQFYDNGQLKWTGYTTGCIWPIGEWEEYDMSLKNNFDAIILDIMLPGMDGFEIIKNLRINNIQTPILVLSAKSFVGDRIKGL